MNNVSHKKMWNARVTQVHVDPPPTPLIKSKHGDNSEKDFVKQKLRGYLMSDNWDLYEFKVALFDNGNPEDFFVHLKLQHKYIGVRNDGDEHKGTIYLYASLWRRVTSD